MHIPHVTKQTITQDQSKPFQNLLTWIYWMKIINFHVTIVSIICHKRAFQVARFANSQPICQILLPTTYTLHSLFVVQGSQPTDSFSTKIFLGSGLSKFSTANVLCHIVIADLLFVTRFEKSQLPCTQQQDTPSPPNSSCTH